VKIAKALAHEKKERHCSNQQRRRLHRWKRSSFTTIAEKSAEIDLLKFLERLKQSCLTNNYIEQYINKIIMKKFEEIKQ
jgi:hypothetical protein